jgi:hypothetical protein
MRVNGGGFAALEFCLTFVICAATKLDERRHARTKVARNHREIQAQPRTFVQMAGAPVACDQMGQNSRQ